MARQYVQGLLRMHRESSVFIIVLAPLSGALEHSYSLPSISPSCQWTGTCCGPYNPPRSTSCSGLYYLPYLILLPTSALSPGEASRRNTVVFQSDCMVPTPGQPNYFWASHEDPLSQSFLNHKM